MYADRIIRFGEKFQGRLEDALLRGTLDYVEHNEESLAFEILCDHICEYDIAISSDEYSEAVQLAVDMAFELTEAPFKYLSALKT
jgi:hypothetical protein